MVTRQSQEDYLEAIYTIQKQKGSCRSVDVANFLAYSKPSVSVACRKLRENGYLEPKAAHGELYLTKEGWSIGRATAERHAFLREWLIGIGVAPEQASRDACGLDHMISDSTIELMKKYIKKDKA